MKIANEKYVSVKNPNNLFTCIDVVPLRQDPDKKQNIIGAVITPKAGITTVSFSKHDLCITPKSE